MLESRSHTFHIPVLGLAFSIDTPIRVARYGIASVISIVDDILIESMRRHHSLARGLAYSPITQKEDDYRAKRITAYLNLVHDIVRSQTEELRHSAFEPGSEIEKYFELLPDDSPAKSRYHAMHSAHDVLEKRRLQEELRMAVVAGAIDVNIMTKLNKSNFGRGGIPLPMEYSDAFAALRGFAESTLTSSVVLSAGMNPRLYSYLSERKEFLPDANGMTKNRVILKVSDHRSACIQGKFLAKKGIWISEFRIESGLNCGGHAFATDGLLLGPILQEFKDRKEELVNELFGLFCRALGERSLPVPSSPQQMRITVQGGIGTAAEDRFLRDYFQVDGTGWGSPFLLVPEATNLDEATRMKLATARPEDYYISSVSPLGIAFNNIRGTTSEQETVSRVESGRPGSPCTKKYLVSNTEFTSDPICTASRQYQDLKIKQLSSMNLPPEELKERIEEVTVKSCLCEDLASAALIQEDGNETPPPVAVCPGPNLAFFSTVCSLRDMVAHIYGRNALPMKPDRPNMFINELRLYIDYLSADIRKTLSSMTAKEEKYFSDFRRNLLNGVNYYRDLIPSLTNETEYYREQMSQQLSELKERLSRIGEHGGLNLNIDPETASV